MASALQVSFSVPLLVVVSVFLSPAAAQSKAINDLAYILPLPVVFAVVIIVGVIIFCMMRRARYGYFCCIKPRVIRLPDSSSCENSDQDEEAESGTSPRDGEGADHDDSTGAPSYSVHPNSTIAPPDYQDALQDVLVVRGDDESQPPNYDSNEEHAETQSEQPNTASTTEEEPTPPEADDQQEEAQTLEDVSLDDDSAENCDDTTPLNPN